MISYQFEGSNKDTFMSIVLKVFLNLIRSYKRILISLQWFSVIPLWSSVYPLLVPHPSVSFAHATPLCEICPPPPLKGG